jgi:tetrahydromethanopterin S-methyltransferase subunit G
MSNSTRDTLANTRQIKNAMERLDDLEKAVTMVMSLVDREVGTLVTQVNALSEVINASRRWSV